MKRLFLIISVVSLCTLLATAALAKDAIRFGVPPWPGATMKSEVVTQILDAMGYETEQFEVGAPIIYNSLTTGELDAFLASWIPLQNSMFLPLQEKDALHLVGTNVHEASSGLCVPDYVYETGVTSVTDLDKNAEKFNHTFFSIEPGTGMHNTTGEIIANNAQGLGDWEQMGSTTPSMLSVVQDKIKNKEWVVFHCWRPHWMNVLVKMKYLEGTPDTAGLISNSVINTLVSNDFKERFPEAYAFLKQLSIKGETQSLWIHAYGYEKIPPKQAARTWISENLDTVATWLEGVSTKDGDKPAIEAVREAYQ